MAKKESFQDILAKRRSDALKETKKKRRDRDATRPRVTVVPQAGLTEPARDTSRDDTKQMTPLDKELALSQDRSVARKDERGKQPFEVAPTTQMSPVDEKAMLEKDEALAASQEAKVKGTPEPSSPADLLAEVLEEAPAGERKVSAVEEPPTMTDQKALTDEEVAEPPTMTDQKALTDAEARKEPPTVPDQKAVADAKAVAGPAETGDDDIFSPPAETDDSVLRQIEEDLGMGDKSAFLSVSTEPQADEGAVLLTDKKSALSQETAEKAKETVKESQISSGLKHYASEVISGGVATVLTIVGATAEWAKELLGNAHASVVVVFAALMASAVAYSAILKRRDRRRAEWLRQRDKAERGEE